MPSSRRDFWTKVRGPRYRETGIDRALLRIYEYTIPRQPGPLPPIRIYGIEHFRYSRYSRYSAELRDRVRVTTTASNRVFVFTVGKNFLRSRFKDTWAEADDLRAETLRTDRKSSSRTYPAIFLEFSAVSARKRSLNIRSRRDRSQCFSTFSRSFVDRRKPPSAGDPSCQRTNANLSPTRCIYRSDPPHRVSRRSIERVSPRTGTRVRGYRDLPARGILRIRETRVSMRETFVLVPIKNRSSVGC